MILELFFPQTTGEVQDAGHSAAGSAIRPQFFGCAQLQDRITPASPRHGSAAVVSGMLSSIVFADSGYPAVRNPPAANRRVREGASRGSTGAITQPVPWRAGQTPGYSR